MTIKERYKDWDEAFQMKKKYSKNFPFCFYDLIKKYLPEDKSATIMDVGCGTCRFEDYLKLWNKYENLMVLDGNPITIEKLRNEHNNRINIMKYIVPEKMPFEKESVDFIFCGHLIEHLYFKQLYELLKEFDRVLKKDGILVVSTPMMWVGFFSNFDHVKPYHSSIFEVYFCDLMSGDASYEIISKDYKVEELVYRYFTHVDIHNKLGSPIKILDFVIQGLKYLSRALGIKKYKRTGYTIILRKGK